MMNLLEGQCVTIATAETGHHIRTSGSQRLELNQQNASWRSHSHKGSILGLISSHLEASNDHKGTCINTKFLNTVFFCVCVCVLEVKRGNKGKERIRRNAPWHQSISVLRVHFRFCAPGSSIFLSSRN